MTIIMLAKHQAKLQYFTLHTSLSTAAFFLGGSPELRNEAVVYSTQDRQRLRTEAMGTVHLRLGLILRNFEKYGVEVS